MTISLEALVEKYNNCVDALDSNKSCVTCRYNKCEVEDIPCNNCYNELLGFPVNPTQWTKPFE